MNFYSELLAHLTHNDAILSRTVIENKVNTNVSSHKGIPLLHGEDLAQTLEFNRALVARFIEWRSRHTPKSAAEPNAALLALAYLTNFCILTDSVFRQWDYETTADFRDEKLKRVRPDDISAELVRIGDHYVAAIILSPADRLAAIASMEWDIGIGPLHPFYDGCGRISRYFAALLSLWLGVGLARHTSRDKYMQSATEGRTAFVEYYLALPRVLITRYESE